MPVERLLRPNAAFYLGNKVVDRRGCVETQGDFGILQIDAHCDLRKGYEGFKYSHASIMYNALEEIPQLKKLVQVGIRDYCGEEVDYIAASNGRVVTYFDKDIKERQYEGQYWQQVAAEIIDQLPEKVFISFDIDGLDQKTGIDMSHYRLLPVAAEETPRSIQAPVMSRPARTNAATGNSPDTHLLEAIFFVKSTN